MEELANEVSGATTSLIDQVLREYGDPGENDGEKNITQDNSSEDREEELLMSESEVSVDSAVESEQLTDKELATLRVLRENPNATQAELVEDLGVSRATISQRVNAIDGFDWSQRHELINPMIENGEKTTTDRSPPAIRLTDSLLRSTLLNRKPIRSKAKTESAVARRRHSPTPNWPTKSFMPVSPPRTYQRKRNS